jgi:hypothetical protein
MYTYRIVLDAYNSRDSHARSARVVTYARGFTRQEAFRRIGSIRIASDGTVSDGINDWPGTRNMPRGNVTTERSLPEYTTVSVRAVKSAGKARILCEYALA